MRVCLDPGHDGVIDPGAVGQGGTLESDVALAVCQYTKDFLEAGGHQVMMTRSAPDADVNELYVRTAMAQEWGAELFVSIHCNAFSDPEAHGFEVWTTRGQDDSDVLATALQAGMTVDDLAELELAYAPPYGSAKDPVNFAGMAA